MSRDGREIDRLAFLDSLRGVAALSVVCEHGLEVAIPGYTAWAARYFSLGQAGVCLFLLISGFIIPFSLERGGSNVRFWWRRLCRLFPLYWLSIGLAYLLWHAKGGVKFGSPALADGENWLINLTMLQEFAGRPHVLGVYWTLTLELVIYGCCSVLFGLGLLGRTVLILVAALGGYALLATVSPLLSIPCGKGRTFLLLTALIGMAAQRFTVGKLSGRALGAAVAALLLGLTLSASACPSGSFVREFDLFGLLASWAAAYAAFAAAMLVRQRRQPPALVWCGLVSYSLYLVHPLVLLVVPSEWPSWVHLTAYLGATLALSAATFYLVERSGIELGRALERRLWPQRMEVVVPERRLAA